MGKIVVSEFVSVDGVSDDPAGAEDFNRRGWTFRARLQWRAGEAAGGTATPRPCC
jgi:hypothetical protein